MSIDYSIDKFLGIIDKAKGPSHKNRFEVIVNFPEILGNPIEGETINLLCESAEMPEHRVMTEDYESTTQVKRIPYTFTTEELNFTFHLNGDYAVYDAFQKWVDSIINAKTYELAYKNEITAGFWEVWQLNKRNEKSKGVKLFNVFPTSISKVEFSDQASNAIQSVNISVVYDYKEILNPSFIDT